MTRYLRPAPAVQLGSPEVTLLTSAYDLPEEIGGFDAWKSGITSRSTSSITADARAQCATGDLATAAADATPGEFEPFTPYIVHGCEGFMDDKLERQYRREAMDALDAKLAWQVSRELWTGTKTGNPSLQSTATDIGGQSDVSNVAAHLIATYQDEVEGGQVFLHVPLTGIPALTNTGFVTRSNGRLVTADGHIVVPGPGYPTATGSWGPEGASAAASGEIWMYASSPVEYAQGSVDVQDVGAGTAMRQNLTELYVRRPVIYRFDVDSVLAALATVYTL